MNTLRLVTYCIALVLASSTGTALAQGLTGSAATLGLTAVLLTVAVARMQEGT